MATPEEINKILNSVNAKEDDRSFPDDNRRIAFRRGWAHALNQDRTYTDKILNARITWQNLGYRFGHKLGDLPSSEMDDIYEQLTKIYKAEKGKPIPNDTNSSKRNQLAKIDRNSIEDAKMVFENLLPNQSTRSKIIAFLGDAIIYADRRKGDNWNLNLDKNGRFIQFNTGQEYCIKIMRQKLLILCDRTTIKLITEKEKIPVTYRGYDNKNKRVESDNIDNVPDCLTKTKNSIGCLLPIDQTENYLDYFKSSNKDFIRKAINTTISSKMRSAHSKGAIEYLAEVYQPIYAITGLPTWDEVIETEEADVEKAKKLTQKQRQKKLRQSDSKPRKKVVSLTTFMRNPYVIAEVLDRADGLCERCKKKAPFLRDRDDSPYLEVHHIIPLAQDGDDTVENAIALCPNCHRHAHFGTKTY